MQPDEQTDRTASCLAADVQCAPTAKTSSLCTAAAVKRRGDRSKAGLRCSNRLLPCMCPPHWQGSCPPAGVWGLWGAQELSLVGLSSTFEFWLAASTDLVLAQLTLAGWSRTPLALCTTRGMMCFQLVHDRMRALAAMHGTSQGALARCSHFAASRKASSMCSAGSAASSRTVEGCPIIGTLLMSVDNPQETRFFDCVVKKAMESARGRLGVGRTQL